MTEAADKVVAVEALDFAYRTGGRWLQVLNGVSLDIREGEVLGLVGESGCGKSTLAYTLLGYLRSNARVGGGRVLFRGADVLAMSRAELDALRGNRISLVPQNPTTALSPHLRVGRQLAEVLVQHAVAANAEDARARIVTLFGLVGLPDPEQLVRRYPHELSGGQQQRVCIAMALACDPDLLVLDEPTTGLDVTTQSQIIALLAELRQRLGMAMLYVTHDLGVLAQIADRVGVMYAGHMVEVAPAEELFEDLRRIARSLRANRGTHAGVERVEALIERVRCFGFHFAALDVRQDSQVHRRAAGQLLGDGEFEHRTAGERTARLAEHLSAGGECADPGGAEVAASLGVMRAIADARALHGDGAVGLFLISMAQGPDDTLAVLALARAAGMADAGGGVPLDVAPLFETVDDLLGAPESLRDLLQLPVYRAHLESRGGTQWVMLGYSDSNKTSGLIASRVALQRAQSELLRVAGDAGVELRFFHGRGGSISRGGSKPRDAVLAAPAGSLSGHLRVTEQGEIIRAKFGLQGIAERTLGLLMGATLERTMLDTRGGADEGHGTEILDELARTSRDAYRELFEGDPESLTYFQRATPIDVIERLALGSRPSRRREMRGIEDLRAIPWVFSWTQSRHVLPGWYGAGTALLRAIEAHGVTTLRELRRESAFFSGLLRDIEMVLAKADLGIARRYAQLAGDAGTRVFGILAGEFERTRESLLDVLEIGALLERDVVLRRAIELRNPYIDPMSFLQVDLLARWRAAGRADPELEHALFATVHGIARGLKNTG